MLLAKNVVDVGLSTNNLEPMLRFWQQDAGLRFDQILPVRRGQKQYRYDADGSVIKLNHHMDPLPEAAPSGYREVIIAREDVDDPCPMVDPDGNRVRLVPPGHDGVTQLGIAMGVRSLSEHRRFYGDILGFSAAIARLSAGGLQQAFGRLARDLDADISFDKAEGEVNPRGHAR